MELVINNNNQKGQSPNIWKISNRLLDNPWHKKEVFKRLLKYPELKKNEIYHVKISGMQLKQCLEGNLQY